jgi:hypothetical protein
MSQLLEKAFHINAKTIQSLDVDRKVFKSLLKKCLVKILDPFQLKTTNNRSYSKLKI